MIQHNRPLIVFAAGATMAAGALFAQPGTVDAQIRGSERGAISQVVNGTTISIDYGRPHVRGRTMFGGQIHWGEVWTPGANLATTIEFSSDVDFVGAPVSAGTYSVWVVPAESGAWEVILDPNAMLYHTQPPTRHEGQVVVSVTPEEIPLRESLLFDFARVEPYGTDLDLRFESISLPLRIDVQGEPIPEISEADAAVYVGGYEMEPPPGAPVPPGVGTLIMDLTWEDGHLIGVLPTPEGPMESMMIPAAEHVFQLGLMLNGEVFEVEQDMYLEFVVEDGQAVRMDARGLEDMLMFSAERVR